MRQSRMSSGRGCDGIFGASHNTPIKHMNTVNLPQRATRGKKKALKELSLRETARNVREGI